MSQDWLGYIMRRKGKQVRRESEEYKGNANKKAKINSREHFNWNKKREKDMSGNRISNLKKK